MQRLSICILYWLKIKDGLTLTQKRNTPSCWCQKATKKLFSRWLIITPWQSIWDMIKLEWIMAWYYWPGCGCVQMVCILPGVLAAISKVPLCPLVPTLKEVPFECIGMDLISLPTDTLFMSHTLKELYQLLLLHLFRPGSTTVRLKGWQSGWIRLLFMRMNPVEITG